MKKLKRFITYLPLNLGFCVLLAFSACKKDKQDFSYDNRDVTDARKNSLVRVINLGSFNQVVMGNDTLTNYVVRTTTEPLKIYPGTKYFPSSGRLGSTWNIPQELLKSGKTRFMTEDISQYGVLDRLSFDIQEDVGQPLDYYALISDRNGAAPVQKFIKIPRSIASPSDPAKFKIRILNLSSTVAKNAMENLVGPMSLTWADGTPVSDKTSNIQPGQFSDYVELSYTTAQFKVLTASGIQVPGVFSDLILPASSTLPGGSSWPPVNTNLTYTPFKTYMPGGVYTIVISPYYFRVPMLNSNPGDETKDYQNGVRIINDISEPLNMTYARVQAVNALPAQGAIQVTMNGKPLGAALEYASHTDYQEYIVGTYDVEAKDAKGNVLAGTRLKLDPNNNFTLWLYPDADGKAKIVAVPNDLSNMIPRTDATDDGTFSRYKLDYPFGLRFLNLCPDIPYATFTKDNGQVFLDRYNTNPNAVNNLRPGIFPVEYPYIQILQDEVPYKIMTYRSAPAIVPGSWASDVPVLTGKDLIARPELYVRGGLPNHEPGIYTIALIGTTKTSAPAGQKAKMIIVKHTK
ncbi:DUF4397 domain-containing protein [Pedobacter nutrimenti]|uniref:Uncharacterized protein DUF4397 n=1 Tax=Pedobacter nutrimenti TaxID=1241337 RepID=A0A318UFJ4_9SPHI|nr:DUF4397 domain-containing protein [Pedobacter nutrimenti]PYF75204.1 uncharacterized protein DUF4397 [Pedobacter nutrimenti]